jgi:26S proteasome regulatory subunit N7
MTRSDLNPSPAGDSEFLDSCLHKMPAESMEVEKAGKADKPAAPAKVKADDDTETEGAWMRLADLRYRIASKKNSSEGREKDLNEFLTIVKRFNAVAVYEVTCKEAGIAVDAALVEKMKAEIATKLKEVDDAIQDAKENEGDMEVRDGLMAKAQILARTADKETAKAAYAEAVALPKTTSSQKLDVEFHLMRLGLFWNDIPMLDAHVQASQVLIDNGGDWERRNRLKVYEATYRFAIRDFKKAATLLLDSIATFTASELYQYPQFVFYTVVCSTISLDRKTVRSKVINAPEILQVDSSIFAQIIVEAL